MNNHRYTEFIVPMNRFIRQMPPKMQQLLAVAEGGLMLVLALSVALYIY